MAESQGIEDGCQTKPKAQGGRSRPVRHTIVEGDPLYPGGPRPISRSRVVPIYDADIDCCCRNRITRTHPRSRPRIPGLYRPPDAGFHPRLCCESNGCHRVDPARCERPPGVGGSIDCNASSRDAPFSLAAQTFRLITVRSRASGLSGTCSPRMMASDKSMAWSKSFCQSVKTGSMPFSESKAIGIVERRGVFMPARLQIAQRSNRRRLSHQASRPPDTDQDEARDAKRR